jgi:hypothetical protein
MEALDSLIPKPRLLERDYTNLAAPPERVWEVVRHGDLTRSLLVRALFAVRTVPSHWWRLGAHAEPLHVGIDSMRSTPRHPGFQILYERAPYELTVGAIGKVWHLDIPFVHVADPDEYAGFAAPDYVKVAWAVQIEPLGACDSRLCIEVRVDATGDAAWRKFQLYFGLIGPGSRFIRHSLLRSRRRGSSGRRGHCGPSVRRVDPRHAGRA